MDMAAGFEHMGRATASGVDAMVAVVEPGSRAVECAQRIQELAREIGVKRFFIVGNKVTGPEDEGFIRRAFPGEEPIGFIPFANEIRDADRERRSVLEGAPEAIVGAYAAIADALRARIR